MFTTNISTWASLIITIGYFIKRNILVYSVFFLIRVNCYALLSGGMISREIIRSEYLSQNLPLHLMHWGLSEYPPSINKNTKQNKLPVRIWRKKKENLWEIGFVLLCFFFFFKPKLAKLRCNISGNKKYIKAFLLMSTKDILLRLDTLKRVKWV